MKALKYLKILNYKSHVPYMLYEAYYKPEFVTSSQVS